MRFLSKQRLENRIEWIAKLCGGKDILDVGCVGGGEFHRGRSDWLHGALCKVAKSILGVDTNRVQVEKLRRLGYNIVCANAETFVSNSQKFEVITAGETMEHLDNVGMFLDCAKENLRPNGRLVITVPNIRHPYYFFAKGGHVEHVYIYLPFMMENLLRRHGFEVESTQYFHHPETRWFGKIFDRLILPFFPQLAHNFGVVAKKREKRRGEAKMKLVSVVMPVLNGEKYLRQSIESILNQTHQNLELILVENGSVDATPDIIREYSASDGRVRVVPEDLGISDARNRGIDIAHGEYIAVQDVDDISLPRRLEEEVEYLEGHRDVVAVGTQSYIIDEGGEIIATPHNPKEVKTPNIDLIHGSVMIRKGTPIKYKEPLHDEGFLSDILKMGRIVNLPEFLYKWRLRRNSKSYRRIANDSKLSPDIYYRYRLCRTLTWGGRFERATKEIRTLLTEKELSLKHRLNLVACYIVAMLRSQVFAVFLATKLVKLSQMRRNRR